ncbi:MAG: extracellular solute-binding protein [Oscillospiraceae bacterium]|nr:extracellular solute-binding protein [Oscillospiraceae bacterium]
MKKILAIILVLALTVVLIAACNGDSNNGGGGGGGGSNNNDDGGGGGGGGGGVIEDVTLRLWGGEDDQAMLRQQADAFIALVAGDVNLTIEIGIESEGTVRDTVLTDPQAAADVFAMPDDVIVSLYMAGALQEISLNTDAIKSANAASAIEVATVDGKLLGYPMTADNGYFLYYNSEFLSADDVQSWDGMMAAAAAAGKQVSMHMANGWYSIGFFRANGLDAWREDDGTTGTTFADAGGTDVLQAMLDINANPGFVALGDGDHMGGLADGSLVAVVNGPWNAETAQDILGEHYAAAKLPTVTIAGTQKQMGGVLGFKLMGVNAFSENVGWAMRLAEYLTNYDNQVMRFEMRQQAPTNIQAAASPAIQANPALAAIGAQAAYSKPMLVGDNYWGIADVLFEIVVQNNPDGTPLQTLLDNFVAGVSS